MGRPFAWHDFPEYDLDAPFPQEALVYAERGFRTGAEKIARLAKDNDFTHRQTVEFISAPRKTPFAGSPATVAASIQEWFEARALDGLNYSVGHPASGTASARRSSPSSRSAASSARNTNRRRCAATWASPPRKTATRDPGTGRLISSGT
jgi:alkanesulfonate monooxygenase SsuD/methylene tetrahydromethanopterin reductase-like flavin-dependent oxidoreductase (luciferase family)